MLEAIFDYKLLLIALIAGGGYLLYVRPKLKQKINTEKETVYVCDICDEHDCDCHLKED